jgi:general secretion pathway protein G
MKLCSRTGLRVRGFTLIELLVVMAIIATLAAIAAPRYFNSLEKSREVALHANLRAMREAIDHYYQDKGTWPTALEDLVKSRYLREIPVDPVTRESNTWVLVTPLNASESGVRDVRSGAQGQPRDGTRYEDW